MKTLLTFLLLLSIEGYGQSNFLSCDYTGQRPSYSKTIKEEVSQQLLTERANAFVVKHFPSYTKMSDNTFISKGYFNSYSGNSEWGKVCYSMTISCFNGKYTYLINGFYHEDKGYTWEMTNENRGRNHHSAKEYDLLRNQTITHIELLANALYFEMQNKAISEDH